MESIQLSASNYIISRCTESDLKALSSFSCGVDCLDTFFHNEIGICSKFHYITPYCVKYGDLIVAVFTLSNDTIVLEEDDKNELAQNADEYKFVFPLQTSFPAVNIGHLGVRTGFQSKGIGEIVIRYVWQTFVNFRVAGCQFLTVDALNNSRTNKFYLKCEFQYQSITDSYKETRRMYLPLF